MNDKYSIYNSYLKVCKSVQKSQLRCSWWCRDENEKRKWFIWWRCSAFCTPTILSIVRLSHLIEINCWLYSLLHIEKYSYSTVKRSIKHIANNLLDLIMCALPQGNINAIVDMIYICSGVRSYGRVCVLHNIQTRHKCQLQRTYKYRRRKLRK